MAGSIALGRYVPRTSPIHRMDPRIKLVGLIVALVSVFLDYGTARQNYVMYGIFFVLFVLIMLIGKVSFLAVLRSLKGLWIMMILLFIVNALVTKTGGVAFSLWGYDVYWDGIIKWGYVLIRLLLMIMLTTILTGTTKPLELTYALEWLLAPLNLVKIPVHMIAMTLSLSLRFIPTLEEEADKIMRAQASRGVDFKEGKFKDKFKAIISLVIPLFVSSLLRSGDLADAMEARGYDPLAKRTRYRKRSWDWADTFALLFLALFLTGVILLAVYRPDFISLLQGAIQ
jgi:energy-coupling factor transport system permease protein